MGNPIAHSLSPQIHQSFAKQVGIALDYQRILVPEDDFEMMVTDFFNHGGRGLNITMPFKERACKLADQKSDFAMHAQAVNTLWQHDGILYGDNTDGIGFIRDLSRHIAISEAEILIVGAGGAARSIALSLIAQKPKRLVVLNRTLESAQRLQALSEQIHVIPTQSAAMERELQDVQALFSLVVQTTPASYADLDNLLANVKLASNWFGYDLNYNRQEKTNFVKWADNHNGRAVDGWGMLVEQAAEAFYLWHGIYPNCDRCKSDLKLIYQTENP